ncbi:MAG: CDP-alcohol phosphatidyltransferase family protein [Alphaproteobacteria bacterium]|nr:CDP-alcohol phosphatidyltransferase family protein [Alphaproteobacteria bacterium]MBM3950380.1 CDP-alcohol phosphatidyltransferase family protein [Rhodospirillales bacterium]
MSHDTWIHHVARVVVRPLAKTAVTPNQLTTVRLATGIAAAGTLAVGHDPWPDVAAGVFVLAMVLDRADGELARMTGKTSPFGHTYDLIADALCNALIFVALGAASRDSVYGYWAMPMGIAAGLAVAAILGMVVRVEKAAGARAAELGGFAKFDPDDAMLVVPLAIWLGGASILLVAAAVGAPLFAALFAWKFRRQLFGR